MYLRNHGSRNPLGPGEAKLSLETCEAIEQFIAKIDVLPWDSAAAKEYGTIRARLEELGKPLANMDMLIAAHASANGAVLVTNDLNFDSVHTSLRATVSWADDLRKQ